MAVCEFELVGGDFYGLGIRIGFYLQWLGQIWALWMAPDLVNGLREANLVFIAATFLALIIITATNNNSIEPVETYIVLLLMFGQYLALFPIWIWRILTGFNAKFDPSRWPKVRGGKKNTNLTLIVFMAAIGFQYWFWFRRVAYLDDLDCEQYGFLFTKVRLNSRAAVVINGLVYGFLGLVCLAMVVLKARKLLKKHLRIGREKREENQDDEAGKITKYGRVTRERKKLLQNMEASFKLLVSGVVVIAVELTISWNNLTGINSLNSVGQTIPFVIGIATICQILWASYKNHKQAREERDNANQDGIGNDLNRPDDPYKDGKVDGFAVLPRGGGDAADDLYDLEPQPIHTFPASLPPVVDRERQVPQPQSSTEKESEQDRRDITFTPRKKEGRKEQQREPSPELTEPESIDDDMGFGLFD